jgi:hypothetical protein
MAVKKKKEDFVELDVVKKLPDPKVVRRVSTEIRHKDDEEADISNKIDDLRKLTEKIKLEKETERHKEPEETKKEEIPKQTLEIVKEPEFTGEVLKTNIDRLYDLIKLKNIIRVRTASKALGISYDMVEEWARVLEDNDMVKLHYPTFGEPVIILRKFKKSVRLKGKGKAKIRVKRKRSKAFFVNIAIIIIFVFVVAAFMGYIPYASDIADIVSANPMNLAYIIILVVIIFAVVVMFRAVSKQRNLKESVKDDKTKRTHK